MERSNITGCSIIQPSGACASCRTEGVALFRLTFLPSYKVWGKHVVCAAYLYSPHVRNRFVRGLGYSLAGDIQRYILYTSLLVSFMQGHCYQPLV